MNNRIFRKAAILIVLSFPAILGGAAAGQSAGASSASPAISEARAAEIALGQTGGGQVVDTRLKRKHGEAVYSVLVIDGGSRITVRVDASSGMVLRLNRKDIERTDYPDKRHSRREWPEPAITSERAREIALERAGGGTVIEVVKDFEKNGRIVYEVEVIDAGRECEIEIDGQTGAVVEYKEEMSRF